MRTAALYLLTLGLASYAWKNWFRSACGLLVLTAFVRHPDYPEQILGIPGLHPWNALFLVTFVAWLSSRGQERRPWDMPGHVSVLLLLYLGVVLLGFSRALVSPEPLDWGPRVMVTELLVNPLKYAVLGLMLFDGARSRERLGWGLGAVLLMYLVLSLLVIRWIPVSGALAGGREFQLLTLRRLRGEIGYYRTDLAVMLAGASWVAFALSAAARGRLARAGLVAAGATIAVALALTAGRGGYLAWMVVGLVMAGLRWKRYLLVAPLALAILVTVLPGVAERALEGLDKDKAQSQSQADDPDEDRLSAGRFEVWPFVLDKIWESPYIGFGRLGFQRSGLENWLATQAGVRIPHPHNAYLEWVLDNGWVGMAVVLPFYLLVLHHSLVLFRDSRAPEFVAAGGVAFALVFAQLVGGVSGRHWYPEEETVGMWCAIGLMLRVWTERLRLARAGALAAPIRRDSALPAPPPGRPTAGSPGPAASLPSALR